MARVATLAPVIPLSTRLPHGRFFDYPGGIVLLSTPKKIGTPTLALGCAWQVEPRNVEVCDEGTCLDLARMHEHLLRCLPLGSAAQFLMTIRPVFSMPAWEALRASCQGHPVVCAQQAAIRRGFPHEEGATKSCLREVRTLVTFRLPVTELDAAVLAKLRSLFTLPSHAASTLKMWLQGGLRSSAERFEGHRHSIEETLAGAGHGVERLAGEALGQAVSQGIDPLRDAPPVIQGHESLGTQLLRDEARPISGGFRFGQTVDDDGTFEERLRAQVLSLQKAPLQSYPGLLCAPRAPEGTDAPLSLWQAWPGPLTVTVNVAAIDSAKDQARLEGKAFWARLQSAGSTKNAALHDELDRLLKQFFVRGGQTYWSRIHVVLWGQEPALSQGVAEVKRRSQLLNLEFMDEPGSVGSTLLLHTLPLGFDPDYAPEWALNRMHCFPSDQLANLLPLYGGLRGDVRGLIAWLNQRGEAVYLDPFDRRRANPHFVINGMSGGGKSFTVASVVNQVLPIGANVVILDQLPSYEELCAIHNGKYLRLEFDAPTCFNSFYGPLDRQHLAVINGSILEMASAEDDPVSQEQRGVLAAAVGYHGRTWDRTRGESSLGIFVEEVLQDGCFAPNDADARQLAKELCRKLNMFYGDGPYAPFVDGPNTLALDERLTVIELTQLAEYPDLQAMLFLSLSHLLTQFYNDPARLLVPKFFFSDETWKLLEHPAIARIMLRIARTYRKLNTSAWFLSQNAEDFDSPVGRILRSNAVGRLFLQQEADERALAQGLFKLSAPEVGSFAQAMKHTGWSSAFLQLPGKAGGQIHLVPDAFLRLGISQDTQDRWLRQQALEATGGDMLKAVQQLVEAA